VELSKPAVSVYQFPMASTLCIVIVNWNAGRHLLDCLDNVRVTPLGDFELEQVVVVDNASSDGSADNLHFPELPLSVVRNSENRGFAAASNQGARGSSADYLLFLNPDTRVLPDSFQIPIEFLEKPENAKVGICGIQLLDEAGNVSQSCSRFPTAGSFFSLMLGLDRFFSSRFKGHFLSREDHLKSRPVDQVMGAFFLVRRKLFESLSGFDERFFVYFEDLDFSYRAKQTGWESYHLATAQAYHRGGGCSENVKARRLYYSLCSRILYSYKHFGAIAATAVMLATLLIEPFSRLALAVSHGSKREAREIFEAYLMLWEALPSLLKTRSAGLKHKRPGTGTVGPIPAE
jgi:N-acetylglucosaminyl-diphospho-decaprenol L-rhamnosyltransferase